MGGGSGADIPGSGGPASCAASWSIHAWSPGMRTLSWTPGGRVMALSLNQCSSRYSENLPAPLATSYASRTLRSFSRLASTLRVALAPPVLAAIVPRGCRRELNGLLKTNRGVGGWAGPLRRASAGLRRRSFEKMILKPSQDTVKVWF